MLKLTLGCGYRRMAGFVNVDVSDVCGPDLVANLEHVPWPWATDSVGLVSFHHSLEHMCATPEQFLALMSELYRVCCNDAVVSIRVPHPRHDDFMNDPTHVRAITPDILSLFDRELNDAWKRDNVTNTPLAHYLGVDFKVTGVELTLAEPYLSQFAARVLTPEQVFAELKAKNNVAKEYSIELRVRKTGSAS
jgi:hypothetical protein